MVLTGSSAQPAFAQPAFALGPPSPSSGYSLSSLNPVPIPTSRPNCPVVPSSQILRQEIRWLLASQPPEPQLPEPQVSAPIAPDGSLAKSPLLNHFSTTFTRYGYQLKMGEWRVPRPTLPSKIPKVLLPYVSRPNPLLPPPFTQSLPTPPVAILPFLANRPFRELGWKRRGTTLPTPFLEESNVNQARLRRAIEVMDLMQQAELDDFFGEACLTVHSVQVEAVDPQAAVVYAIVLATNLEVIVSIPHQPLQHFRIGINAETLATVAEQFRQGLVIRSRRLFLQPGQQLYNWLIRPSLDTLEAQGIETLVFVLDGPLRNLPMAALHDGQKFLVEQYGVAMTPSVNLLAPQPLSDRGIKTLAAGLTQARDGFPPLTFVGQELDVIEAQVPGLFLRDQAFTRENLQHKLLNHSFSLVHIATHGQFSSEEAETFLLTWDGRLSIRQLGAMIQSQSVRQRPIELLILSACETAAGNHQAALGLAGMAVRAGARSTLASLWAVSDESTAVLMGSFYQNLGQAKMAKAQALRQAQIELIRNPRYQHPFYWSAFVLMGNWL